MHLWPQMPQTTHSRRSGDGWFSACWGTAPIPGTVGKSFGHAIENRFSLEEFCHYLFVTVCM